MGRVFDLQKARAARTKRPTHTHAPAGFYGPHLRLEGLELFLDLASETYRIGGSIEALTWCHAFAGLHRTLLAREREHEGEE